MYSLSIIYQGAGLTLIHFGNALMVLGSHCKASHVGVNINGLHQTVDGVINVHLLVAIGRIHVAGASIMTTPSTRMQSGCLAKAFAGFSPVLAHLEHVASALITLDGIFDLVVTAVGLENLTKLIIEWIETETE